LVRRQCSSCQAGAALDHHYRQQILLNYTLARQSKGGGYQDFYSKKCVNKTSCAIFGSSHLQPMMM